MIRWAILIGLLGVLLTGSQAHSEVMQPFVADTATRSKVQKVEANQHVTGHWQNFGGVEPFVLGGDRSLFFAQLHLQCTKRPKWVKIRLARLTDNGLDTTGTNTWVMGANAPLSWQGSLWWESKTTWPITAQFKVKGGQCYSDQRQFKFWQP